MQKYKVLGIMSGTSLDGLDLALCEFYQSENKCDFMLLAADVYEYPAEWKKRLNDLFHASALEIVETDAAFAQLTGKCVNDFLNKHKLKPDLIASHGHTVFHQPEKGFTAQIGNGAIISSITGFPVVSDFRTMDVALGGNGAPLVPIGDALLFNDYNYCLNLGGIANISYEFEGRRLAGDICPANMVLNYLAQKKGLEYDKDGLIGRTGNCNVELLNKLNDLGYYKKTFPKSLGREWVESEFLAIIAESNLSLEDLMATCYQHFAFQIASALEKENTRQRMLITGGGAFNSFLIDLIREESIRRGVESIVPDKQTVAFKEALIFAFLGFLRLLNRHNCLSSVTGASTDNIGGALYGDFSSCFSGD